VGALTNLENSFPDIVSSLKQAVYDNPKRLINDEANLARDLGIEIEIKPYMIRYYKKTGRVTIAFNARTRGVRNAIRFMIIAPPNDKVKKNLAKKMLQSNPDITLEVLGKLNEEKIKIDEWWN